MNKKSRVLVGIVICFLVISHEIHAEAEKFTQAEEVAKNYMTAFFHGHIEVSFGLMHPEVLDRNKEAFLQSYEEAKQAGKGEEFTQEFDNIDDFDSMLALPSKEFFILLVTKNREGIPAEELDAMKKASVTVVESSRVNDETVQVLLEIITPTENGTSHTQQAGLLLSQYNNEWRVVQ